MICTSRSSTWAWRRDLEQVFDIVAGITTSQRDPLLGELPHQFGIKGSTLWARPSIDGLDTIQARLDSELGQHNIQNASAISDLVVEVSSLGSSVPDSYTLRPPQTFQFDRLAIVMGDDVYEFPFGALSSSAVMASGAKSDLSFDGDDAVDARARGRRTYLTSLRRR